MSHSDLNLASLIGSRICHDLISPIGAIGNGLELLEMAGGADTGPEMELISQSVENANARIKFFRVAFGLASNEQSMSRTEITALLTGITKGGRVSFNWQPTNDFQRDEIKAVFLAFLCIEGTMPYGGELSISHDGNLWKVLGTSEKILVDQPLWDQFLHPGQTKIMPATVHFSLLPTLLHTMGRDLKANTGPQMASLQF